MKNLLLCIALLSALACCASAQPITTANGKKSDEIYLKLRKIDLLNQILPLLLTKDQINKILPAVERARAKQKAVLTAEDDTLAKLQNEIDEVYAKAIEKQEYPTKDFLKTISTKTAEMAIRRDIARAELVEDLTKTLTATLNAGQRMAMVNSFSPKFIDPSKKPEDISEAMKTQFYIERVMLDPLTRELLIDLAANKKD